MQIEAPIREVSVYTDRALVARRGQVTLKPGVNELTIENIPTTLVAESVRAAVAGLSAVGSPSASKVLRRLARSGSRQVRAACRSLVETSGKRQ